MSREEWPMICVVVHEAFAGYYRRWTAGIKTIKGRRMFFVYFNKLGWPGSILLSIVVTLVLVLAFRLVSG